MNKGWVVLRLVFASLALGIVGGCGDSTGVGGPVAVSVNFRASGSGGASLSGPSGAEAPRRVAGPPLVLVGTNGTLSIEKIWIIVNEAKLKNADRSCDFVGVRGHDCAEFEAPPRFLDLPLDGEPVEAVTASIPAGVYEKLEFEIEDLEDDESDPAKAAAIRQVRTQVRAVAPDWPKEASALVTGSFTANGRTPVDFRVFLEAEVEVEMDLVPHLVVDQAGAANRNLTVDVSPDIWFRRPDGTVVDLARYHFDATGATLEFKVEMESGFTRVEID